MTCYKGVFILPLVIMKLAIEATTTTTVSPISTRYFTVVTGDVAGGATLTLDTAEFFDDAGNTPAGLPALNPETLPLNYL